jgi:transposase
MNKAQLDYFNYTVNVMPGDGIAIGREITKEMENITITLGDKVIYNFWNNPKEKPTNKPPKHTGGKPSYIKIMLKAVQEHKELSLNASGFFLKVADNIQWESNLLIDKRSKKPLNVDDISKVIGIKKTLAYEVIRELKGTSLLIKDKEGFKISTSLIQKGGAKG